MKSIDRYNYNVDKILNINPDSLPLEDEMSNTYINRLKKRISDNIENLINMLGFQLTDRQVSALREVKSTVQSFHWLEYFGVREFRFEGAGSYRAGLSDE